METKPSAVILSWLAISSVLFVGVEDALGIAVEQGFTGAKAAYSFRRQWAMARTSGLRWYEFSGCTAAS